MWWVFTSSSVSKASVQFVSQHRHRSSAVFDEGWYCISSVVVIGNVVVDEVRLRSVGWRIGTEGALELLSSEKKVKVNFE